MKKLFHILFWVVLIFWTILALLYFSGKNYLNSDKTKVVRNFPFLKDNEVHFGKVELDLFNTFPEAKITLHDFVVFDNRDTLHREPVIKLNRIEGEANLENWKKKEIVLDHFFLRNGELRLITNEEGVSNFRLFQSNKNEKNTEKNNKNKGGFFDFEVNEHSVVELDSIDFQYIDSTKYKNLRGLVHSLIAEFEQKDSSAAISLDFYSKGLTFNWYKGPYLENSHVTGHILGAKIKNGFMLDADSLHINDEVYDIDASIYPNQPDNYTQLNIIKPNTSYDKVRILLPYHIQEKLSAYHVAGRFPTSTNVSFETKINPRVEITYRLPGNNIDVKKHSFTDANGHGMFINRIYDDERSLEEDKRNIRLLIDELKANYSTIDVEALDTKITYTPVQRERIDFTANVTGKMAALSSFFEEEKFRFTKGDFEIESSGKGPLYDLKAMIKPIKLKLDMDNVNVLYEPTGAVFVFDEFDVVKRDHNADYFINSHMLGSNNEYSVFGEVVNVTQLFFPNKNRQVLSKINLRSEFISWHDFSRMLSATSVPESREVNIDPEEDSDTKGVRQVISAIHNKFQPELDVKIDTLTYKEVYMYKLRSFLDFENDYTLVLSKTSFETENGDVQLDAKLNLQEPDLTGFQVKLDVSHINLDRLLPKANYFNISLLRDFYDHPKNLDLYINTYGYMDNLGALIPNKLEGEVRFANYGDEKFSGNIIFAGKARGDTTTVMDDRISTLFNFKGRPNLLNNFFPKSDFKFQDGIMNIDAQYSGEVPSVEELIRRAKMDITIDSTKLLYEKTNTTLPIKTVFIEADNNQVHVNTNVVTDSSQLTVHAEVKNAADLIYHPKNNSHAIIADLTSKQLNWPSLHETFSTTTNSTSEEADSLTTSEVNALKETIINMMTSFNPTVTLVVDDFLYSDNVHLHDVTAEMTLTDNELFSIKNTGFTFLDGDINLEALVNLEEEGRIPFEISLDATNFEALYLLDQFNFFNSKELRAIDSLNGLIELNIHGNSVIGEKGLGLLMDETNADVELLLSDGYIGGYKTLQQLGKGIIMKHRFDTVRLAPVKSHIRIENGKAYIPFTEIQSNAANVFFEGYVSEDARSIWITVPLSTIFSAGWECVPELNGSAAGKNKLFVELTQDEKGESKTKIHISKKKFFQQRYSEDEWKEKFKAYKKEMRRIRRENRKNKQ